MWCCDSENNKKKTSICQEKEEENIQGSKENEEFSRMPNICSCVGCFSNKPGQPKKAVFRLPKEPDLKERLLKFLSRKDVNDDMKYVYVCDLNFEDKNILTGPMFTG